jgi:hypothetical protein
MKDKRTAKYTIVLFSFENSTVRTKIIIAKARNERASNLVDRGNISIARPRIIICAE